MAGITTQTKTHTLKIEGGGVIRYRRIRRSVLQKIMEHVDYDESKQHTVIAFAQLCTRVAIIDVVDVPSIDGGVVGHTTSTVRPFGKITGTEVIDQLGDDVFSELVSLCTGQGVEVVDEDQRGNSDGSPD